jgi:hypothetical protein
VGNRATNQSRPATGQIQSTQADGGELTERGRQKKDYGMESEMKGCKKKQKRKMRNDSHKEKKETPKKRGKGKRALQIRSPASVAASDHTEEKIFCRWIGWQQRLDASENLGEGGDGKRPAGTCWVQGTAAKTP